MQDGLSGSAGMSSGSTLCEIALSSQDGHRNVKGSPSKPLHDARPIGGHRVAAKGQLSAPESR